MTRVMKSLMVLVAATALAAPAAFAGSMSGSGYSEKPGTMSGSAPEGWHQANLLNVNTATVDQLAKIPVLGEEKAKAIVAYRDRNGPFQRLEDLTLVKGISEYEVEQLRQKLMAQ